MDLGLANKVVLITGGDKGIGGGITRAGGERRSQSRSSSARNVHAIQKTQAELKASGSRSFAVTAELSRPEDCARAVRETLAVAGRLDALVNNAGVNDGVGLESGQSGKICSLAAEKSFALLLHGALRASRSEGGARIDRQYRIEGRHHGPGQHVRIRGREGRHHGVDARMGRRTCCRSESA